MTRTHIRGAGENAEEAPLLLEEAADGFGNGENQVVSNLISLTVG